MPKVLILGAGKIGALISGLLAESGSYEVHLADVSGEAANAVVNAHRFPNLHAHKLDATDTGALDAHLKSHPVDAVISGNEELSEYVKKLEAAIDEDDDEIHQDPAADLVEEIERFLRES